jgi:UDP:flavonoid glycosyltransferase YjiC (YdhE family)
MAHIVISTSKLKGLLFASFEMASRLISEGHTISYMCPLAVKDEIENEGFHFIEVPEMNQNYRPNIVRTGSWIKKFKLHLLSDETGYENVKNALNIPNYKNALITLKPDLILCDMELQEIILTAFHLKIPIKLISPFFNLKHISGLPSIRCNIIPNQGISGSKIGIHFSWLKFKCKIYGRYFLNIFTFRHYRRHTLKKYAREVGFPVKELIARNFPTYFLYNNLTTLSMTIQEMDFPHKAPSNFKYIGVMVYENRADKGSNEDEKVRISNIIDIKTNSNKKLIYCGLGSLAKGDLKFINKLFEAVKNQQDWLLIISLGKLLTVEDFQNIPDNVHVFSWVAQPKLLKHVDCCINHAGINTINECLHNKVPMLIYSGKVADENGNAARIQYHGLGISRDKDIDNPTAIKNNIAEILSNDSYKSRMIDFNKIYKTYQEKNLSELLEIDSNF